MCRQLITLLVLIFAVASAAYGVRQPHDSFDSSLRPEAIYFAHHINARLQDPTYRRDGWGMARLSEEVDQMMTVFQTSNNHADLVKEAVDVAVAAMMAAHTEGQKQSTMAAAD